MFIVSESFLDSLLGPLYGHPADVNERLIAIDANSQTQVTEVIRERIVPMWRRLDDRSQPIVKESLRWLLNEPQEAFELQRESPWEYLFYSVGLYSLGLPDDPKQFFIWLWHELFGNETFLIDDFSQYKYVSPNDPAYINWTRYRRPDGN